MRIVHIGNNQPFSGIILVDRERELPQIWRSGHTGKCTYNAADGSGCGVRHCTQREGTALSNRPKLLHIWGGIV
jgi:hypothetical protein